MTAGKRIDELITGFIAESNIKIVADQAAKENNMNKMIMMNNETYDKIQ